MKIRFTFLILVLSVFAFCQEKINTTVLEKISSESNLKYISELAEFSQKINSENNKQQNLIEQFAGYSLGAPLFYHSNDSRQAIGTNTDLLYNNSIPGVEVTGNNMKIFMWEINNVFVSHNDLLNKVTNVQSGTIAQHGTGVAGVLVGSGLGVSGSNTSRGMAYNATLSNYTVAGNISEISAESANIANSDYMVSNHSYGTIAGWNYGTVTNVGTGWFWYGNESVYSATEGYNFGYYGQADRDFDNIAYNAPQHLIVKSASNDRGEGPSGTLPEHWSYNSSFQWVKFYNVTRPKDCGQTGFDCIPTSSLGKNIITVGSVQPLTGRYSQPSDVLIANDSSFGPADDGRIKPDVVAVGVNVYSANNSGVNQYTSFNGTSFSSPAVTGNFVLLQQLYEEKHNTYLRSDLGKALIIHTANEAGDTPGPDYKFGWGLMDVAKSAELIIGKDQTSILQNHTLNNGETYKFSVRGIENSPLKVTIVWLDPAAPVGTGHNDRTPQLVNDLDLRISDGLTEYLPWKLDVNNPSAAATKGDNVLDNVEQIIIDNPIEGLNYEISVAHKENLQGGSQVFAIVVSGAAFCPSSTIWDGLAWSNGAPDATKKAIISGNLILSSNLEACELEVTSNGNLQIPSGFSFMVNGIITNNATPANFVVSSGANLIQDATYTTNDNEGAITVERESQDIVRLDYTMWSSPVTGQQLQAFSPATLPNRIYTYETTLATESTDGGYVAAVATSDFANGKGYLFRTPNTWGTTPAPYAGAFLGVPFNGAVTVPVYNNGFTSVGNPYASNIDPELFMVENDVESLYFWNNPSRVDNGDGTYSYVGTKYVAFTGAGFDDPSYDGNSITVGQGFLVESSSASSVTFNNEMRTSAAGTFFKTTTTERHRIWLNLSNESSQTHNHVLVSYMSGATNGLDSKIDGQQFGYEGSALYSLIDAEKFSIQGRALPFAASDVVALGFKAVESGKFNISLAQFDGLFAEGEVTVYLKDKQTKTLHNLSESAYGFESAAGEFNDRFEIVYETEEIMGSDDLTSNSVQIYTSNNQIVVSSKSEKILSVELFDLQGRNMHSNHKVNADTYQIKSASKGVLVVKVQTQNGEVVTRKLISE